jgi:hypothetical protein
MILTAEQKKNYYRRAKVVDNLVKLDAQKDKHIIYGAQAINAQLPGYLKKQTEDYDIYANNPKKEAKQMEKKLDKAFGGDFFESNPAEHSGTWKVKSKVTKRGVVDYTKPTKKIKSTIVGGNKYEKIKSIKKHIEKTLQDEASAYRHDKDFEALQRIRLNERGIGW